MPRYLRSIRQGRWAPPQWLGPNPGDVQSDALGDLGTNGNLLSVYRVNCQQDVDRVAVALAANRDNLQNVDYAVFDDTEVQGIGIQIRPSPGRTPNSQVNKLHHDIGKLTAQQTADLAAIIAMGRIERCPRNKIKVRIKQAIQCGELDRGDMKGGHLSQLS